MFFLDLVILGLLWDSFSSTVFDLICFFLDLEFTSGEAAPRGGDDDELEELDEELEEDEELEDEELGLDEDEEDEEDDEDMD